MARRSLRSGFHWATATLAVGLWAGGGFPARAQLFPFFGQSEPPRPAPQSRPLTLGRVRAVLAQEGARLIGRPRQLGQDIVAIGGDDKGNRKRFTLDATTGEVLDVTVLVRREAPPAANLAPPGAPLSAPQHGPDGSGAPAETRTAPASSSSSPTSNANPEDSALSPIRPQHSRGAPKVEPLPQ